MSKAVRTVDAFYEATGPYAVDKGLAEGFFENAFSILSGYTGKIALKDLRGMRIPLEGNSINPRRIKLGAEPHTMLLTRRFVDTGNSHDGALTTGVCDIAQDGSFVKLSKTIVQVQSTEKDPTGAVTLFSAVHEGAHSFGLEHCADEACIMYPRTNAATERQLLSSGASFREDCAEDLEVAAYLALADTLA